jgi:hypothetical protein
MDYKYVQKLAKENVAVYGGPMAAKCLLADCAME